MKIRNFAILSSLVLSSTIAHGSSKKKVLDPELIKREEMVVMSRQLGVTCTYCHNEANFRDASIPAFKIALDHIAATKLLNEKGFKGKPQVDCYMCHKGAAKPDYKEPAVKKH